MVALSFLGYTFYDHSTHEQQVRDYCDKKEYPVVDVHQVSIFDREDWMCNPFYQAKGDDIWCAVVSNFESKYRIYFRFRWFRMTTASSK